MHYVAVDSLDEMVERVQSLGGKLVRPKAAVPKIAWYAVVEDLEGNIFAMWQADATAFPRLEPEVDATNLDRRLRLQCRERCGQTRSFRARGAPRVPTLPK